jgi:hypothetical protein
MKPSDNNKELALLDAFSLAANFFMFLLIIVLTLTSPYITINPAIKVVLIVLAVYSACSFIVFSVLMFAPTKMNRFRELLSHTPETKVGNVMRILFIVLLWLSLPITLLAGIVDSSANISESFRHYFLTFGLVWLLVIPLLSILVLSFRERIFCKLRDIGLSELKNDAVKFWRSLKILLRSEIMVFFYIFILVAVVQASALLIPKIQWLAAINSIESFLKVLWQVHASVLGVTIIVVTIVITIIANEKDRTRTWALYSEKTRFVPVVWFNLIAIISEGVAALQASQSSESTLLFEKTGNLILTEGFLIIVSILLAAMLFSVTVKFLNDDYVENLAEKRIIREMPSAVDDNIKHIKNTISRLRTTVNGH